MNNRQAHNSRILRWQIGNAETKDPGAFNRFIAQALPIKSAMRLKAIARSIDQHLADYNETRIEALKRFGKLNKETGNYEFDKPERQAEFNREYRSLLDAEVELPGERFQASSLLFSVMISPADLMALEWLIDDGTPVYTANDEMAEAAVELENGAEYVPEKDVVGDPAHTANNTQVADILELEDAKAAGA